MKVGIRSIKGRKAVLMEREKQMFGTERFAKPWLVWRRALSAGLRTERSLVRFPVRTHVWVAGQVSSWEGAKSNQLMFLSLSLSPFLLLSLKINK